MKNFIYLMFSDDNKLPSTKRVIAMIMALMVVFVIVYTCFKVDLFTFSWASTVILITSVFAFIGTLLGMAAYERKNILKMGDPAEKEEEKRPD
jgi:hypothetical protein